MALEDARRRRQRRSDSACSSSALLRCVHWPESRFCPCFFSSSSSSRFASPILAACDFESDFHGLHRAKRALGYTTMSTSMKVAMVLGMTATASTASHLPVNANRGGYHDTTFDSDVPSCGAVPGCTPVFYPGLGGSKCFRIPTVIQTRKGTLLAFSENRKTDCGT